MLTAWTLFPANRRKIRVDNSVDTAVVCNGPDVNGGRTHHANRRIDEILDSLDGPSPHRRGEPAGMTKWVAYEMEQRCARGVTGNPDSSCDTNGLFAAYVQWRRELQERDASTRGRRRRPAVTRRPCRITPRTRSRRPARRASTGSRAASDDPGGGESEPGDGDRLTSATSTWQSAAGSTGFSGEQSKEPSVAPPFIARRLLGERDGSWGSS